MAEPKLQPPGAGLPLLEHVFLKYLLMPVTANVTSWEEAQRRFLEQTDAIISLYQQIKPHDRAVKILIPRLTGLEDSSRYWSANMVLEHVMIVTEGITQAIEMTAREQTSARRTGTADVKPQHDTSEDMVGAFWEMMHQCAARIDAITNRTSSATHPHPWFGPMNSHAWHTLLPMHHAIHRRQLEKIVARL